MPKPKNMKKALKPSNLIYHLIAMSLILAATVLLTNCERFDQEGLQNDINENSISSDFAYETTKSVDVKITTLGNDGTPFTTIPIYVSVPITADSFAIVYKGFTNDNGVLDAK